MCKGLTIDDVGVPRGTVLQEIRPGAGFEPYDFVKEKLGGLPQNDSIVVREGMEEVFAHEDEFPLAIFVVLGDRIESIVASSLSCEESERGLIWNF